MRILLDENLPEALVKTLAGMGHDVDSVNSLRLKGIDNSALYQQAAQNYEIFFTKDAGFIHNIKQMRMASNTKLLRVVLQQKPSRIFVSSFVDEFVKTDWSKYKTGDDWP